MGTGTGIFGGGNQQPLSINNLPGSARYITAEAKQESEVVGKRNFDIFGRDMTDLGINTGWFPQNSFNQLSHFGTNNLWGDQFGGQSWSEALAESKAQGGATSNLTGMLGAAHKGRKQSTKALGGFSPMMAGIGALGLGAAGAFLGAGAGLAGSGGSLSGLTAGGTLGSAGVAGSGAAGLATGSGLASVAGGLGGLNVGGTAVSNTGAIFGTPTSSIGATGLTGGSTIGATGAGGGLANTSGGIFESIKSGFSSIKDAASTLSTGKDIVGGLLDLKNGIDAKKQAEGLQASAVPDPTSDRVRAQLEAFFNDPSLADVDQRWLDQLAKDYTRNASAQHGVDSGAYVEGLINVLNRGRKEWLESREGAGRGLLTNSQLIAEGNFNRQSNAASWQIDANTLFNRGASGTVAGALDFIFG